MTSKRISENKHRTRWSVRKLTIIALALFLAMCVGVGLLYIYVVFYSPGCDDLVFFPSIPIHISVERCNYTGDWIVKINSDTPVKFDGLNIGVSTYYEATIVKNPVNDDPNGPDIWKNEAKVYLIPYNVTIKTIPLYLTKNYSLADVKNAIFAFVDRDANDILNAGDYIRIYVDYNNDGNDDIGSDCRFVLTGISASDRYYSAKLKELREGYYPPKTKKEK